MKFWLTTLGLYSVIHKGLVSKGKEKSSEKNGTSKAVEIVETGKDSIPSKKSTDDDGFDEKDYLCHGRILSALSASIYNIFCTAKTAFELWEALEFKYGAEDAGLKRYYAEKILDFQMVDGRSVMEQAHEFQNILYDLKRKGMDLTDTFLVASLIKKLPPSWSKFAREQKQKHDDYTFDELLVSLNIEEKHREKLVEPASDFLAKVLIVENLHKPTHQSFKKTNSTKQFVSHSNNNNNKQKGGNIIQEKVVACWVCGNTNHKAKDCYYRKGQPPKPRENNVAPRPLANVVTVEANSSIPANRNQAQELKAWEMGAWSGY
ncbi:uncharacterized protein LOC131312694 [Rhododendron vialii]|uniref:uncharacterized protein LOC131312694 n=1 Tax=Rhododendron vialii TaxID=182163 RepID=UPI00265D7239|nr:uncharacterized protein LOC131312694 [Rhododendron vialii]